uniref:N-terminal EF-hand calcium-binding protein 1-like n=1 Tax=Myxine glutinosa TaxID=7769 RepID=UPI00358FA56B
MDGTKREYTQASGIQQFVTRFLLRETSNQMYSLQTSLSCATDAIHTAQTSSSGLDVDKPAFALSNRISKHGRRLSKTFSSVDNLKFGGVSEAHWVGQLNRLQKLTQTLPKALHLEPREEEIDTQEGSHLLLVQRQISTLDDKLEGFQEVLQDYTKHTNRHASCLHITVQKLAGEPKFVIYEFWENSSSWKSHFKSQENKSFQRGTAELLDSPEIISSMMVPTSWWSLNDE